MLNGECMVVCQPPVDFNLVSSISLKTLIRLRISHTPAQENHYDGSFYPGRGPALSENSDDTTRGVSSVGKHQHSLTRGIWSKYVSVCIHIIEESNHSGLDLAI